MKWLLTTICFVISFVLSAQSGQSIVITYNAEDTQLIHVFEALEHQYGIRFSYATNVIENLKVSGEFNQSSLEDFLSTILFDASMEYKVVDDNVLIRKAPDYVESDNVDYINNLHLRGQVTSELLDNEGVDYAAISIIGTSIGTYADENGKFDLEIPQNFIDSTLRVSYVGFKDLEYKVSELDDEFKIFSMSEEAMTFDEITIVNRSKPISCSPLSNAFRINSNQIQDATSSIAGYDLNRTIQLLPGVAAHNDESAEILIRGSNSDETLVVLDGMPLYETTHYYKIFSAINSTYVDSITVFKNMYPVQFGGRTAGLVEMKSHQKIPDRVEGEIVLDLMKVEGRVAIPISEKIAISGGVRSSLGNIENSRFNTLSNDEETDPIVENFEQELDYVNSNPSSNFNDFNGKLQYQGIKSSIGLNVYLTDNIFENSALISLQDKKEQKVDYDLQEDGESSTRASSLILKSQLSNRFELNVVGYAKQYFNTERNILEIKKELDHGMNGQEINNPDGTLLDTDQDNEVLDAGVTVSSHYHRNNNKLILGLMIGHKEIDYDFKENKDILFKNKTQFNTISGFTGWQAKKINDKLIFDLGVRVSYYTHLRKSFVSPRAMLSYQVTPKILLKVAGSHYEQVVRKLYYEYRGAPKEIWVSTLPEFLPTLQCTNFMVGTTLRLGSMTLDIEGFNKVLSGLMEYSALDLSNNDNDRDRGRDYLLFFGDGYKRGFDVLLSGGYANFESYISYSWSMSKERYREIYKYEFFTSENDRRHQLKWVNTYLLNNWLFGATYIYSSGRYYTDINNIDDIGDIRDIRPEDRLSQLPAYSRLDVSARYAFDIARNKAKIGIGIMNLLDTQNVSYIQSISTELSHNDKPTNTVIGTQNQLLDRTLNVVLSLEF